MSSDVNYKKLFDLHDRVAVVAGGASGIGKAIAFGLAAHGANVLIADIDREGGAETAAELDRPGKKCLAVETDVAKPRDVDRMTEKALAAFNKIDILVNSAGISRAEGPAANLSEKDWDETIAINLKGTFLCCQAVVPHMKKQKSGRIINIASIDARTGSVAGGAHYPASKGGVISLTITLAKRLASSGILVNAIAPGNTLTDMVTSLPQDVIDRMIKLTPLRRLAEPREIAAVAVFLASDMSSYVNGQVIHVDGGVVTF